MLQALRDKTSGPIAMVILGLLIIAFAFVGVEQYLVQRTSTTVATIDAPPTWWQSAPAWWPVSLLWDRDEVTVDEFRSAFEQERQQRRDYEGDSFDPRAFESMESKRAVLERLIDRAVQRIASEQANLAVSNELVRQTIAGIPAFQVDGRFNPERYQLALASRAPAQTPAQFEQTVRDALGETLLTSSVAGSHFVTEVEMDRLVRLLGERRDVALLMLPPPAVDVASVSDEEIRAWYERRRSDFRQPETVSIEYVELDAEAIPAPAEADEATLRERFKERQGLVGEQEQRLASHILIEVAEDADPAAQEAAQKEAAQLAAQARAPGADFAALVEASSDDIGSRDAGGDIGWISRGAMPEAFEQALFALEPGAVSAPVKTEFGWHVIQLREIKAGQQETFEQAREGLAREQAEADRERALNERSGIIVDSVLSNPGSLASAAEAANLPVQKSGPFSRDASLGTEINPAVRRAAFSEALIQDGTVSDPIELAPDHFMWIRVVEHTPERTLPLEQVRDRVLEAVRADRARIAAMQHADALLARLRGGESLQAVAETEGLSEPTTLQDVPRGQPLPDIGTSETVFSVQPPAKGEIAPGKHVLPDGQVVLFVVHKVTPGDAQQVDPQQRETLQQQVADIAGSQAAESLVSSLRRKMKIEVVESSL
ncbi:MAG: SurA N-terminal domain-containing protein [Pseudomonadota bacterium]|nr:SurA N-terminal domain-containing protein [Pseudomonadota bacterium]